MTLRLLVEYPVGGDRRPPLEPWRPSQSRWAARRPFTWCRPAAPRRWRRCTTAARRARAAAARRRGAHESEELVRQAATATPTSAPGHVTYVWPRRFLLVPRGRHLRRVLRHGRE